MEILNWQRGYGKTFKAIQEAKQRNLPLIVATKMQKDYIQDRDKEVEVYTAYEWQNKEDDRNVIIDELPLLLNYLGFNTEIATMTSDSLNMYDIYFREKRRTQNETNWML